MERPSRIEQLFEAARALDTASRSALLDSETAGERELRAEVESLLEHHDRSSQFLARPLIERELAAPARIGAYRVLRELGAGGMGVVYLAEQEYPRREVALKVLRPGVATVQALRRFEHEAQVLARLQHPGIAQIFEAGTADYGFGPQPYFALEWVRGPQLREHVEQRALGTRERLRLLASACDALAHAHQRGVIHRDLKPSNILVDETSEPPQIKLLDFGIARVTDAQTHTTSLRTDVGQVIGTLPYMSPEQASGDPDAIDERSDVYALGVIGYELLCGRLPLDVIGKPLHEAVRIVREDEPMPLSRVAPTLRGDVETIFAKALEKERERRYASAAELAADLRRYLEQRPIVARRASRGYVLAKFARRNRVLVGGVAAVFVALVAGLFSTGWQAVVAAGERDRADDEARKARGERDRANREAASAVLASQRADQEARRARAVARFQQDMLSRMRPEKDGREVKLADALDAAAASLPGDLAGDPASEAAVRGTLGVSYFALGLLAESQAQLERALELYRAELGPAARETLEIQGHLAVALGDRGAHDEARRLSREAYQALSASAGAEHPSTLVAELNYAGDLSDSGDVEGAARLARANLEARRRVFGEHHRDTAAATGALGGFLWKLGRLEEAEPYLREALEGALEFDGESHPATLTRFSMLASCLRHRGAVEEAEQLYRRALAIGERVLGREHVDTLTWMNNLAALLSQTQRYDEAGPLLRHVVDVRVVTLGEDHEDTLIAMNNLALLESNRGNYAASEELHRRTLALKRGRLGDEHRSTLSSLHNLALALLLQGELDEALPLFREASARAPGVLPSGHWQIAGYRESYGACLQKLQRLDEAESELSAALELMRESFPDDDARVVAIAERLFGLYSARGDVSRAQALRERFAAKSAQ